VLVIGVFVGCGKKAEVKLFSATEESYSKFVNAKTSPQGELPDISSDKHVVNQQYPVEIALYSDHRFYYNLPNLGDGYGTWKYEDGKIVMLTKREILGKNIEMTYELQANDPNAENVSVQFTDRWGAQSFRLKSNNL
jgi:hypothetical protein